MKHELVSSIKKAFKMRFGQPEVIVASPGRINLIGEHTDYNEGFVFPAAIDKCIVAAFSRSKDEQSSVYAYDVKETISFVSKEIKAIEKATWKNYLIGVVGEIQKRGFEVPPFNAVFGGDIPAGSGLSSSAALENSMVFGLNELFKFGLTKEDMIYISQKAEHNYVGVKCGIMDQFTSMFGEPNHALLLDCRSLDYKPFKVDLGEYGLVLLNSNVHHNLAENAYNERRETCEKVASLIGVEALRDASMKQLTAIKSQLTNSEFLKAKYIIEENNRVKLASKYLQNQQVEGFGQLLFEAHQGMKEEFLISCDELDYLVDLAKKFPAAIGARLMGGGFGGCTINVVDKEHMSEYIDMVLENYQQKFNKICTPIEVQLSQGTHLIL